MFGCQSHLLLLFLLRATFTLAKLHLTIDGDEASITYQGLEIFHHTESSPVLSLGYGTTDFHEIAGNFNITDVIEKKLGLVYVLNSNGTSTDTKVTLNLGSDQEPVGGELVVEEIEGSDPDYPELSISATFAYSDDAQRMPAGEFNRLWIRFSAEVDEKVFGGGEQYTYLNLRGYDFPIWTREQGVGRDQSFVHNVTGIAGGSYDTSYWPQASFLSSRHYSVLIQDQHYLVLNFTYDTAHEVYLHNNEFHASMIWASDLLKTVQKVTDKLGHQPPLPDWVMTGATLGLQRGTDEMLSYYDLAKSFGVNVSALWIQDWSGTTETLFGHRVYWNWRWNETYYPDLDLAIEKLAQEGVKVMVYMNPHLILGGDMFDEAASLGHLLKDQLDEPFLQDFGGFMAGTVDLTSDDARIWYRDEIIKNTIDLGFGGWMADFGEYTRVDMISDNTDYTGETLHNAIPVEWARCNREALETSGALGDVVPFMRSGGLGSSGYQILGWAGDQDVDWSYGDGLPSTIVAALNLGLSGMGLSHFDIGGYTTQAPVLMRSKELFLRSSEYAVFTPVMRTHEGNKPQSNHQFYSDEDTLEKFARLTQIHARLLPYVRTIVQENSDVGTPVQRPLFLHYEEDQESWNIMYQYLFGPDLLVAPVLQKKMDMWSVYIPGGDTWVHLWEGTEVTGAQYVDVNSPVGYPPVFYKKGSPWEDLFISIGQDF